MPLRLGFEVGLGDALQTVIYLRVFRFRFAKKKVPRDGTSQFSIYIMVFDLNFGLCSADGTMAIKYKCDLLKYFEQIRSYINSPSMRQWLDEKIPCTQNSVNRLLEFLFSHIKSFLIFFFSCSGRIVKV